MNSTATTTQIENLEDMEDESDTYIMNMKTLNASVGVRIFGASANLGFALISLTLNAFLLIVFVKGHKKFKSMSFFLIAWQMLVCDCCGLFCHLGMVTPLTYIDYDVYGIILRHAFGLFETISFHGSLFFLFLLTLNRFLVFFQPWLNEILFEPPKIFILIGLTWLITLGFTAALDLTGCYRTYFFERHYVILLCQRDRSGFSMFLEHVQTQISIYIPAVMMCMYIILFLRVRFDLASLIDKFRKGSAVEQPKSTREHKEFMILVQSLILCSVFWLQNICSNVMPMLITSVERTNDDYAQLLVFLCVWRTTIGNGVHAIVIFIFNSLAKDQAKILIGRKNSIVTGHSYIRSKITVEMPRRKTIC